MGSEAINDLNASHRRDSTLLCDKQYWTEKCRQSGVTRKWKQEELGPLLWNAFHLSMTTFRGYLWQICDSCDYMSRERKHEWRHDWTNRWRTLDLEVRDRQHIFGITFPICPYVRHSIAHTILSVKLTLTLIDCQICQNMSQLLGWHAKTLIRLMPLRTSLPSWALHAFNGLLYSVNNWSVRLDSCEFCVSNA